MPVFERKSENNNNNNKNNNNGSQLEGRETRRQLFSPRFQIGDLSQQNPPSVKGEPVIRL